MDKANTSFYVGDLEVSLDKHVDEVGSTRSKSMLKSLYDESLHKNDEIAAALLLHSRRLRMFA